MVSIGHKINIYVEYSWFEFRVFLLIDCLLNQSEEPSLPYYLLIAGGKKRWVHAFLMGISTKWIANSFIKDLNLDCWSHFLQW